MRPYVETEYAWNGDVALAYQVVGQGTADLLYLQGYGSHIDLNWESPALSRFMRGLADRCRLIITDRRGWGCSDRFSPFDIAPMETMVDDLVCVLDAAGSERAVILGTQECGFNAALLAATYPDRTRGLILCDAWITYGNLEDPAFGSDEEWADDIRNIREKWGRAAWSKDWPDRREAEWHVRHARASIPPGGLVAEMNRYRHVDLRPIYPTIHVPTLVLGTTGGDPIGSARKARYLADAIPGARLVQHDIGDATHWLHWYGRAQPILDEVGAFLSALGEEEATLRRVLATVLFTDIVNSTEQSERLGVRDWGSVVERHHATVRGVLARFGGTEIDTAGDGFFATFDGPGRAIRAAEAITIAVRSLGIEVRCGLHTGECEVVDGKPGGLAVNIGARIASLAKPSQVVVSDTVRSLVSGSGIAFSDLGSHRLRGIADEMRLWSVAS